METTIPTQNEAESQLGLRTAISDLSVAYGAIAAGIAIWLSLIFLGLFWAGSAAVEVSWIIVPASLIWAFFPALFVSVVASYVQPSAPTRRESVKYAALLFGIAIAAALGSHGFVLYERGVTGSVLLNQLTGALFLRGPGIALGAAAASYWLR